MDETNRRNIDVFTRRAENYRGHFSDEEQSRLRAMAGRIGFGPGKLLVDFGMGTGTSSLAFLGAGGRVLGVEITPAMVRNGLARLRELGLDARARYVIADACAPPLADGVADLAICRNTLHHLEKPRDVFREMARVVRPGGHLLLVDFHYPDEAAEREKIEKLDFLREPSITRHLSGKEMEGYFEEEGIRILETSVTRREVPFDEWMDATKASPDVFPQLRAAFEALRDQGGSWYEEKGSGAEFSVTRKQLAILGQKAG